jgi:UDP-N-acetylglucosamine acyltransferase
VEVGDWVILGGFTGGAPVHAHRRPWHDGHVLAAVCRPAAFRDEPGPAGPGAVDELRGAAPARLFAPRIAAVKAMHKALYRDGLTLEQAQERIASLADLTPEAQPDVR